MKPENKIYTEGGVYNNSKCCYNIKFMQKTETKKGWNKKKRRESWSQNEIKKI